MALVFTRRSAFGATRLKPGTWAVGILFLTFWPKSALSLADQQDRLADGLGTDAGVHPLRCGTTDPARPWETRAARTAGDGGRAGWSWRSDHRFFQKQAPFDDPFVAHFRPFKAADAAVDDQVRNPVPGWPASANRARAGFPTPGGSTASRLRPARGDPQMRESAGQVLMSARRHVCTHRHAALGGSRAGSSRTCMVRAKARMKALPSWLILTLIGFETCIRIGKDDSDIASMAWVGSGSAPRAEPLKSGFTVRRYTTAEAKTALPTITMTELSFSSRVIGVAQIDDPAAKMLDHRGGGVGVRLAVTRRMQSSNNGQDQSIRRSVGSGKLKRARRLNRDRPACRVGGAHRCRPRPATGSKPPHGPR